MASTRFWRFHGTFESLSNPHFRWLWLGRLASSATFQMSTVAQGWLVYQLTGSAFALGWVSAGWSVSTLLLSLVGGVISDRAEKRDLLIWTRGGMVLSSLVLAVLVTTDAIQLWHLAASSLFSGILFSFMMPAQQAIVADLLDDETLLNAYSLNSVGMGLMGIFAASLTGLVIETVGLEGVYYAMGALYLMALFTLTKLPTTGSQGQSNRSIWSDLRDGVRHIARSQLILALLGLTLSRVLFAMPYRTLMPKFAQDVMGLDARGLGVLMAAPGVGSLVSALTVASLGNYRGKGKLLLLSGATMGLALVLFVQATALLSVLAFLALVGAASNVCMVANQTLLQTNCQDEFRGRVMSVYMMMWGLSPLGTMPAGAVADRLGIRLVITIQGVLLTAVFAGMLVFRPRIRRME